MSLQNLAESADRPQSGATGSETGPARSARLVAPLAATLAAVQPLLRSRTMRVALVALLAVDAAFVLAHVVHVLAGIRQVETPLGDPRFALDAEGGYSEWFEYAKTLLCVGALLGCWRASRQPVYLALAAVFGLVAADNMFELHEAWGAMAAVPLAWTVALFSRAPESLGELSFFALEGVVALAVIWLGLRRSRPRDRAFGLAFVPLLMALGGFAIGVDLVHSAVQFIRGAVDKGFTLLEDGGELVVLSLACALALALWRHLAAERRAAGG